MRPALGAGAALALAALGAGCAKGPSEAERAMARVLATERYTTHQPQVLAQSGTAHAEALGLSGAGVRIAIEDSPPDLLITEEFGDRIETDARAGAQLAYIVHDGALWSGAPYNECRERNGCTRERIEVAPEHARQAINDLVLEHARSEGWDAEENKRYIDTASIYDKDPLRALARWWEMPSPRAEPHGTEVAAVAAGARHGVAPQARIVPLATDLEDAGNHFINEVGRWPMRRHIEQMDQGLRWRADAAWAARLDAEHDASDVLIRAYSSASWEPWWLEQRLGEQRKWAEAHIPATLAAYLQSDRETPTLVVHSAGNEGKPYPSGIGQIPYHFADVRGHTVTTVAIDADTQTISERSNRCGALPEDWDAARHGHHYCLAAPSRAWTVRPLDDDAGGSERFQTGAVTSFANPVVAGALALLIEHFRGTRTPEEILARVKATARRDGVYAERDVYGAGHLDIGAALRPVGTLARRPSAAIAPAYGALGKRASKLERASLDAMGFPFWEPVGATLRTMRRPLAPSLSPEPTPSALGLAWAPLGGDPRAEHGLGAGGGSIGWRTRWTRAGRTLEAGASASSTQHLGARGAGAPSESLIAWTTVRRRAEARNGAWVEAQAGALVAQARYEDAGVALAPHLLSHAALRAGKGGWSVEIAQPLRAESGHAEIEVATGARDAHGGTQWRTEHVELAPEGRSVRVSAAHTRTRGRTRMRVEVARESDPGHTRGRAAWQMTARLEVRW